MREDRLDKYDRPKLHQKFDMDSSRVYICCSIVMFHIVPIIVLFLPMGGADILSQGFMMNLNPVFLGLAGFVYGLKNGFNFKYIIINAVLGALSVMMYYSFDSVEYRIYTGIIMLLVYFIVSGMGTVIGGFLRKYMM